MHNGTILVTGGAGYIGSHVCKQLYRRGYVPVAYDNLCSGNEEAVRWGPLERGDIRDRTRLGEIIRLYRPGAVMHFAALLDVAGSIRNPASFYENNLLGTACLLGEMRRYNIPYIVFSSTAAVYGQPESSAPLSEDSLLQPINPYGNTKLASEQMIRDYACVYGMRHAVLRYFNAAGADPEGDLGTAYKKDTHLVPLLMQVAAGERPSIAIYGTDYATPDGTAIRDYIHVSDLAAAHIIALERLLDGRESFTVNLGTNKGCSVRKVIDTARAVTGLELPAQDSPRRPGDPAMLVADASLARRLLQWQPERSDLETILATAWVWKQKQTGPHRWRAAA